VGQTLYLKYRLKKHISGKLEKFDHKSNWLRHLKGLGLLEKVEICIIEECEREFLNDREIFWIAEYRKLFDLTNVSPGGNQGSKSYIHTKEAKEKISETAKKRKGIKLSDEHKKSISESLRGNSRAAGKRTKEQCKHISEGRKGIPAWNSGKKVTYSNDQIEKTRSGVKKFFKDKAKKTRKELIDIKKRIINGEELEYIAKELNTTSKSIKLKMKYYKI